MRVALSLAQFYTNLDTSKLAIDELVDKIGSQIGAVEDVIDLGKQYKGIIIARVVSCADHPDADRLRVCKIDDGGVVQGIDRDENGYVQVVCGAPNVQEGLLVAWLPPGVTVPETYGKEPFVLDARPLRGVVSNGMLASSKELGISDDHAGILEVDEDVQPGTSFAEAYHLNDHIIDIENKMFTHRPDCFGVLGVYREISGIYGKKFEGPAWYNDSSTYSIEIEAEELPLSVSNELAEFVPHFMALPMSDVTVKPSPIWLQAHLMRAGIRPINNIVDITNYLMYLTGQPLHAYDYDKLKALSGEPSITIRYPKEDEKIALLNGKEIQPRAEAIMIASGEHLIGVGGVMGGSATEVDEHTTNIILEVGTFDMYSVRRTSMAHGLFTDAVTRFNKGQSPLQNARIITKAMHEVRTLAGGKVAGKLIDLKHFNESLPTVEVAVQFINERLGLSLSATDMKTLLENVEFAVIIREDVLSITAPFWRTDIAIPEDIVEEIGRLYGYDRLLLVLPRRDLSPATRNSELDMKSHVRRILSKAGANEVLTYTFAHGNLLEKVGQDKQMSFQLSNALSPDLQYYRLSLTPSLLDLVHPNIKAGYGEFALFEMNTVHGKTELDDAGLPREFARIALVFAAEAKLASAAYAGAPYYMARKYLMTLLEGFGLTQDIMFKPFDESGFADHKLFQQMLRPFEPKRSAIVWRGDRLVGVVGEYKSNVRASLKLPEYTAGFEIFGSALAGDRGQRYVQLPRYPKVEQDISLRVPAALGYGELYAYVKEQIDAVRPERTLATLSALDIYQRPDDPSRKQITLRLTLASYERTLIAEEVNDLLDTVAAKAHEQFGAERL